MKKLLLSLLLLVTAVYCWSLSYDGGGGQGGATVGTTGTFSGNVTVSGLVADKTVTISPSADTKLSIDGSWQDVTISSAGNMTLGNQTATGLVSLAIGSLLGTEKLRVYSNASTRYFDIVGSAIQYNHEGVGSFYFDNLSVGGLSVHRNSVVSALDTTGIVEKGAMVGIGVNPPVTTLHLNSGIITSSGTTAYHTFQMNTTTPTTATDKASIWAVSDDGIAEMKVIDGSGNVTKISPHDASGNWVFSSQNVLTGKKVYINMEKFIHKMEELTGEKFIYESE